MNRTLIVETANKENRDKNVTIQGWVSAKRAHGKLIFLDVRDRSGIVQVVFMSSVADAEDVSPEENAYELAKKVKQENVVEIHGLVVSRRTGFENPEVETGAIEIVARRMKIISSSHEMPFDMGGKDLILELSTLLDHRTLALRHPKIAAIFKIQENIVDSYRTTLKKEGFTEIFVPTIVPSATEGGAEVFKIDYYAHKAYLAQSPQMYKQMMVSIFERVFTIAHAYRAEPSVTTRHLSEYVSLDAEFGFISSYEDLMDMAEKVVKNILSSIAEKNNKELSLLGVTLPTITKIPRLKMHDAQEIIFKRTGRDNRNEPDLDPSDEKELCAYAQEETGAPFMFITHFPTKKRPFYTYPDPENPEYTLSFDLLGVNEEWVTGGQRINEYEMLLEHVKKWGNKPEQFELYLQAFRFGMPPEGGFAMGLERITKDILGLSNIREASLFPRDMERVDERFSKLSEQKTK